MRLWAGYALALALGVTADSAAAQDKAALKQPAPVEMGLRYRQSAEVLTRYRDVPIPLETPALQRGRATPTSQEEMETFILRLAKPSAPMIIETLITTPQGRTLPVLYFTHERLSNPAEIHATGRPIVWLIGQQHGNEPAGGEAMLALAQALAEGELRPLLNKITVIIVPRANPDGAASDQRDTSARMDLNRDHATFALPETRALHAAILRLPPDLVIDAHEFSVAQRWVEKFGALQAVDLMLLDATHPMVPKASQFLARTLFQPAIEAAVARYGLTAFPYHTTSTRLVDRTIAMGGNAPGIARNAFGLTGAISLLLETRGVGIGAEGYQRRVATHYIAIRAALEAAATEPDVLRAAVKASRREIVERREPILVRHTVETEVVMLPLLDAATGVTRTTETMMSNSKSVVIVEQRPWPQGYVLLPEAKAAVEVRLLGASTCIVSRSVEIDAEMFDVNNRGTTDRRSINPDAALTAVVRAVRVAIPAGSVYVPTSQAAARRIALALEPDAPGSFVATDVVRTPHDHPTVPIVRVSSGAVLQLAPTTPADTQACKNP